MLAHSFFFDSLNDINIDYKLTPQFSNILFDSKLSHSTVLRCYFKNDNIYSKVIKAYEYDYIKNINIKLINVMDAHTIISENTRPIYTTQRIASLDIFNVCNQHISADVYQITQYFKYVKNVDITQKILLKYETSNIHHISLVKALFGLKHYKIGHSITECIHKYFDLINSQFGKCDFNLK